MKTTPASQASPAELKDLLSALRRTSLFQHASPEDLFRVALDMERVAFQPGDILGPKEGEPQDALFVVTAGRLVRKTGQGKRIQEGSEDIRPLSADEAEEITQSQSAHDTQGKAAAPSVGSSMQRQVTAAQEMEENLASSVVVRATAAKHDFNAKGQVCKKSIINVMCPDRPGLVGNAASILIQHGLSIENSTIKTTNEPRNNTKKKRNEEPNTIEGWARWTLTKEAEKPSDMQDENIRHIAYQVHEVVDAKSFLPVTDVARMRRIEAALRRDLDDYYYDDNSWNEDKDNSHDGGNKDETQDAKWKRARDAQKGYVAATIVGSCRKMQAGGMNAFGTLHIFGQLPAVATTYAVTSGVCWRLSSKSLEKLIVSSGNRPESIDSLRPDGNVKSRSSIMGRLLGGKAPTENGRGNLDVMTADANSPDSSSFAVDIASGLAAEVFRLSTSYSTPLFEQPAQKVNIAAVSVASAVESYYRSALNAYLNAAIQSAMKNPKAVGSVITPSSMFPDMHVQIPTRVLYINGFKLSRQWLAELVEEPIAAATAKGDETRQSLLNLIPALAPGVLMTPISSILEACNAGHSNPEPLYRRWMRGVVPRCGREIIFGLGLNNLTDWAEERIPRDVCEGKVMRNALGSLMAGAISGYFSHVPHNLSTMKLLQPEVSYRVHAGSLIEAAKSRVPATLPPSTKHLAATALALLWPKGLEIRMAQVVGSFVLLNGITHLLDQRK
ncbi:hypothetical protein ACHAWF_010375 [Thalassiosira exigua]